MDAEYIKSSRTNPTTGIPNADRLIALAVKEGLTVTVKTTDNVFSTSHMIEMRIPCPEVFKGTALYQTYNAEHLNIHYIKSLRPRSRGRMADAAMWYLTSHQYIRKLKLLPIRIESMGADLRRLLEMAEEQTA